MEAEHDVETIGQQVDTPKPSNPWTRTGYHSIAEILANDIWPNKFRLVARIKDFYPLRLEDCVILRCMQCAEEYETFHILKAQDKILKSVF